MTASLHLRRLLAHGVFPVVLAWMAAGSACSLTQDPGSAPERAAGAPEEQSAPSNGTRDTPPPAAQAELLQRLSLAVAAYQERPGRPAQEAVLALVEEGMELEDPHPQLDMVLGDALANVLLRPELGLQRLEPHTDRFTAAARDAWLDAWLRQDLARFVQELEARVGLKLPAEHPTVHVLATRAHVDPTVDWRMVRDGWSAARLIEESGGHPYYGVDELVPSLGAAMETLVLLLPGWELEVVSSRTTVPADPDPLITPGVIPADQDRRRVVAHARSSDPAELRQVGTALDLERPARVGVLTVEARVPEGGRIYLQVEGRYEPEGFQVIGATDGMRTIAWFQATNELFAARREVEEERSIARRIRAAYQERFLRGR